MWMLNASVFLGHRGSASQLLGSVGCWFGARMVTASVRRVVSSLLPS